MVLLHSSWLYIPLPWLYFTLVDCIHSPTMALLHSTSLYITLHSNMPLCHSTRIYSTLYHASTSLYLKSTLLHHGSTLLYTTGVYITLTWLYFALIDSTLLYRSSTWLYLWFYYSLLHSTFLYYSFTSLYFTLHYSTMALLYLTLHYSIMAAFCSTSVYRLFLSKGSAWCFVACACFLYQSWLKRFASDRHTAYSTYQLVSPICADGVTSDLMQTCWPH